MPRLDPGQAVDGVKSQYYPLLRTWDSVSPERLFSATAIAVYSHKACALVPLHAHRHCKGRLELVAVSDRGCQEACC